MSYHAIQIQRAGTWVNADPNISPAIVAFEEVTKETTSGDGTKEDRKLLRVTQGDESIFIDEDGDYWDYDRFGLEIILVTPR